jgi:uncharacterized membrane protein YgcG
VRLASAPLLLLCLLSVAASADERILSYDSDITVHSDATMTVIETIRVRAERRNIKRGIYRDFPTLYHDRAGNRYRVGFEILAVSRDGHPEPYHTQSRSNGIRIYIGEQDVLLQPSEYNYVLSYRTNRQLGFFPGHDELYWNVTGNDWAFPIDQTSAGVHLPQSIPLSEITLEAYTGAFGAKGADYTAELGSDGVIYFHTSHGLPRKHGLTIVVQWPKGHIAEPTLSDKLTYLARDNRELAVIAIGAGVVLAYYLLTWLRVGTDPPAGVIVPRYVPPEGFSPASMRFVRRMGYDHKTLATALVNLAVKGLLRIDEHDGKYTLTKTDKSGVEMAAGEQALVKKLFPHQNTISLVQSNHATIGAALEAHKNSLRRNYEKLYFLSNSGYLLPGIAISIAALIAGMVAAPARGETFAAAFMIIWLAVWTVAVVALLSAAVNGWRHVAVNGLGPALRATLFATPFVFFEGMGLWMLSQTSGVGIGAALIGLVAINITFYQLLKAPTRAGRKLLDKIQGFRNYLEVAEGEQLKSRRLPQKTLDLFEIYLPYALALDVEQQWSEKFADVFAQINRQQGDAYQPTWYRHSHDYTSMSQLTSSLGSALGGAISSSSHAPGSSSGGGGGGSSGGGGGGGGGGGW